MTTLHDNSKLLLNDNIDLQQYWYAIARHKWGIFSFSSIIVLLTALIVYSMQPVFRATVTLLIESQQAKVVSIEQIYGLDTSNSEYYATQYEILKSRELIDRVVTRLDLINHPDFNSKKFAFGFSLDWLSWLPFEIVSNLDQLNPSEEELKLSVIDKFVDRLSISPLRKTQLVNITFESTDKLLATKAANALADAYIESHLDARLQMTRKATTWLTGRMDTLKEKLNQAEKRLQDFRDRENLVDMQGLRSLAAKELQEISSSLVIVQEKRAKAENNYKQVNTLRGQPPEAYESIPAVLKHKLIQDLKSAKAKAERTLAEYSKRYGPQHPKMVAAKSKINTAIKNIHRQIATVVAGIEKEFEIAKENEKTLSNALNRSKKRIQDINRKEFVLNELEREVETNRKLYDTFFTRFQETTATSDMQTVNARIMDPAVIPRIPAKPRKMLSIIISFLASLIIATVFVLLRDHFGNTFRSSEDISTKLGVSNLGILPLANTKWNLDLNPLEIFSRSEYVALAESVRTIRTGLILSGLDKPQKITLVTSSVPEEGKTMLSVALAIALGQVEKVLLIDGDMRNPSLTKKFEISQNAPGLSNLVGGTATFEECIHHPQRSGIDVVSAGVSPPNPLELLSSKRFKDVLEELGKHYDRIVIDSPPTQVVSDALILSSHAQAVVYVIKADSTPSHMVKSGVKRLLEVNAPLSGVVLNQLDVKKASKYGRYEYHNGGKYNHYNTPPLS